MHRFITKQRCEACKLTSFFCWRFCSDDGLAVTLNYACSRCGNHGTLTITKGAFQALLNKRITPYPDNLK